MPIYSPITLFVYKRPDHTRRTIDALMKCPEFSESPLYVFCDGAKRPEEQPVVKQTRDVVRSLVGDQAEILEASCNQGLANSIIAGVNQIVNQYSRVIVLEDDLVVSPVFLTYMNDALEKYRHENQVMQISGYMFPVPEFANQHDAMLLPFTVSWGWGTWKRAWQYFDPDMSGSEILDTDYDMRKRFNLDGYFDYKSQLYLQALGQIDSWAIRWYWSCFKRDGLTLFPPVTYVKNCGLDANGTHTSKVGNLIFGQLQRSIEYDSISTVLLNLPDKVSVDQELYLKLKKRLFLFSIRNNLGIFKRKVLNILRGDKVVK